MAVTVGLGGLGARAPFILSKDYQQPSPKVAVWWTEHITLQETQAWPSYLAFCPPNIFTQDDWILSLDTLVSQLGNRSAVVCSRFQSKPVEPQQAQASWLQLAHGASCQCQMTVWAAGLISGCSFVALCPSHIPSSWSVSCFHELGYGQIPGLWKVLVNPGCLQMHGKWKPACLHLSNSLMAEH